MFVYWGFHSFIHSFISQSTPPNVAFTASRHVQEYSKKKTHKSDKNMKYGHLKKEH